MSDSMRDLPADPRSNKESLLVAAYEQLRENLPPNWILQPTAEGTTGGQMLTLGTPGGGQQGLFIIEARLHMSPSDARQLLGSDLARRLLASAWHTPLVVIAPFLSPRTRQLLVAEGHSYLDLTGNIHLVATNPGLYIHTQGADHDPVRGPATPRGLRGAAAGRIIRYLATHTPPSTVSDVAAQTGVNLGYVSKVVDALRDDAFIERRPRGPITSIDLEALISARLLALGQSPADHTGTELDWLQKNDPAWE